MEELSKILLEGETRLGWETLGVRPHHGVAVPLSAIHTEKSCGIGEFFDLHQLIDWCHGLGMDVIQLLPLNDSSTDPSPYNALSSCALNPIYLSLEQLPLVETLPDLVEGLKELRKLTLEPKIPFQQVQSHKLHWLRNYYERVGAKLFSKKELEQFTEKNSWVLPYALFKVFKDRLEQNPWLSWPPELVNLSETDYQTLLKLHFKEVSFYIALQILCFSQLNIIKKYAESQGVFLMGDIPILVSRDSADVWHQPDLFNLEYAAGAPPDPYNQEGQYWGFPLYQWDIFRRSHFTWWKERLACASHFYHVYRIDHVVGFFRIWGIPLDHPAKEGRFFPADEAFGIPQGKELLLMMIDSFPMLPVAEDLGTVPDSVRQCLQELGICGTKVMRWERMWKEDKRFIPIQYYPPLSLTCISTHDSETLDLWWQNQEGEARAFAEFKHWSYQPKLTDLQRKEILWDSHHTSSLFHINPIQEYLALFPELIWPNPEDERINLPGKVLPTNWAYRLRSSLPDILAHEPLQMTIKKILTSPSPNDL